MADYRIGGAPLSDRLWWSGLGLAIPIRGSENQGTCGKIGIKIFLTGPPRSQKFGSVRFVFTEMGVRYQRSVALIIYCRAHFYKDECILLFVLVRLQYL